MAATINEWKAKLDEALHAKDSRVASILEKIESKTGVNRTHIVLGVVAFLALYLTVGYGKDFLCNFIGFVYPAYASIKAIETPQKDDDTKWLTYWVVYSCCSIVESFTDIFLSWIPLYFLLKCTFLLFCMAPVSWNGSLQIYNKIIRPFFLRNEKTFDSGVRYATDVGKEAIAEATKATSNLVTDCLKSDLFGKTD